MVSIGKAFRAAALDGSFPGPDETAGIERGDIVVFAAPDTGEDYVKRVIGLPGERIETRHGEILIDGSPLPLAVDDAGAWRETAGPHTYVVPAGETRFRTRFPAPNQADLLG